MRNKFPGFCDDCGRRVGAGAGHFQRVAGRSWIVRRVECVVVARALKAERDKAADVITPTASSLPADPVGRGEIGREP